MLGIVALTARKWRIEWMWLVRITAGIVIELTLCMYTRSTRGNYMSLWRDKVTANQWWIRQQSRRSTKSVSTFLLWLLTNKAFTKCWWPQKVISLNYGELFMEDITCHWTSQETERHGIRNRQAEHAYGGKARRRIGNMDGQARGLSCMGKLDGCLTRGDTHVHNHLAYFPSPVVKTWLHNYTAACHPEYIRCPLI